MFSGLDLYCTDPAQHLRTAGYDLDDLNRDLSNLSVRRVKGLLPCNPFTTAPTRLGIKPLELERDDCCSGHHLDHLDHSLTCRYGMRCCAGSV